MSSSSFTRIVLRERPEAEIHPGTFEIQTVSKDVLKAGAGEVVVQVTCISLDPAMRGWLKDRRSYVPPVQIGEVMRALGLGIVVEAGREVGSPKGMWYPVHLVRMAPLLQVLPLHF
ncbi:oxidoreductase zinc-binding protein [Boletus reticuloceps]|uniref:Oxidoreductase zinc-binding protein n=1 Tax=Boletus reticuloceps TaxID=495285 RepID=A0A8I3A6P6_9AGAM|nr:oxidoreductase zinc-binding protein [Boletus reticuloceps]